MVIWVMKDCMVMMKSAADRANASIAGRQCDDGEERFYRLNHRLDRYAPDVVGQVGRRMKPLIVTPDAMRAKLLAVEDPWACDARR